MADKKQSKTTKAKPKRKRKKLSEAMIIGIIGFVGSIIGGLLSSPIIGGQVKPIPETQSTIGASLTSTPDFIQTIQFLEDYSGQALTSVVSTVEILKQLATKAAETPTPTPVVNPFIYNNLIYTFDKNINIDQCWLNETTEPLLWFDGFYRREDRLWGFRLGKDRMIDQLVRTDFSYCLDIQQVRAIALNAWVNQLEFQREIGIFVENASGQRREYTIWIDDDELMYLRVREHNQIIDNSIFIVHQEALKITANYPRTYTSFPIQIFFELNNNGLDILYLAEGPLLRPVNAEDIDPSRMIRIDSAVLPAFPDILKIGLIGYGGETQIIVWPLIFYG